MPSANDLLQELEQLAARDSGAKLARILVILDGLGWKIREGKGSHKVARSPLGRNIIIPGSKSTVKRYCVQQLLKEAKRCGGV